MNNFKNKLYSSKKSLIGSGVEGTYLGSFKGKNKWGELFDFSSNDDEPTHFTLIEPFELPLFEVQLFKAEA
jgi:hypothetical protein